MKRLLVTAAALPLLWDPRAIAGSIATATLGLRGHVAIICHVSLATPLGPAPMGQSSIGQLVEFCNDPNGYQVWADYPPGLAAASLMVDGRVVPLSADGTTQIDSSTTAAVGVRNLTIDQPDGAPGGFTLRVVAL
jgi:hypothetical protein